MHATTAGGSCSSVSQSNSAIARDGGRATSGDAPTRHSSTGGSDDITTVKQRAQREEAEQRARRLLRVCARGLW